MVAEQKDLIAKIQKLLDDLEQDKDLLDEWRDGHLAGASKDVRRDEGCTWRCATSELRTI